MEKQKLFVGFGEINHENYTTNDNNQNGVVLTEKQTQGPGDELRAKWHFGTPSL